MAARVPFDQQLISLAELGGLWSCSRKTVARILEKAGIAAYDFTGTRNGTKRYPKKEVLDFMAKCRPKPINEVRTLTDIIDSKSSQAE